MKGQLQSVYQCDCPESSEALGMKVCKEDKCRDTHKFTPTILFRDNQCKYCGHYTFYVGKEGVFNGIERIA